ncbi:MAG TPA: LanC-like protein [Rhizomicrobium sp.]|nr:LanC-like protein [Rhizomicrobium sp.]
MNLFQSDRHESLISTPWNENEARRAIGDIASSALAHFDPEKLWPSHPVDSVPDGVAGVYMGAAGVVLALDHLKRAGAIDAARDFHVAGFAERDNLWLKNSPLGDFGALLMGDMGAYLAAMRVRPEAQIAERVFARAEGNDRRPILELMWGTPGSMLTCVFMHALCGEERFEELYRRQARRLLADAEHAGACKLWTQDIYGTRARYLGLVHGFAGHALALLKGWHWLGADQQKTVTDLMIEMLATTAKRSARGANWPTDANASEVPMLCQMCHGAPGILTAFADAPFSTPDFERLLLEGGELVWIAGPVKKGSNFCHGTGGNAYALLKLYRRTRDRKWLHRARAFAMTGIAQWRAARVEYGRDRYSLWTGDPGFAVCLWSCITGDPQFPALDTI